MPSTAAIASSRKRPAEYGSVGSTRSIRRCGTRARSSGVGFAVPMSIPRYTCPESTLTISTGSVSPSAIARRDLPLAVGPRRAKAVRVTARAFGRDALAPAQEQLVEIGERKLVPGRPPMVALPGTLGLFHLAEQRVHLRYGERTVRADGTVAGERGEELVSALGQQLATTVLAEIAQEALREGRDIGAREHRRHSAHDDGRRRKGRDLEAERGDRSGVLLERRDVHCLRPDRDRNKELLPVAPLRVERGLEVLVEDPLVRGVHVDEHESPAVLREDIDAVQLREGEAEGLIDLAGRCE